MEKNNESNHIGVNILGQFYSMSLDEELSKQNIDGIINMYDKKIRILPSHLLLDETSTTEERMSRFAEVIRHEIIHAFFNESGLSDYSNDEVLVQWMAVQFDKINIAIAKAQQLYLEENKAEVKNGN